MEKTSLGASRLEALLESARLLHGARDLDELLGHLLRSVMGRLLVRRGLVALERHESMRLVLLRGLPRLTVGDVFDAAAAEESGIELVLPIGDRSEKSHPLGLLGLGRPGRPGREAVGEEEKDFLRAQLGLAASGIENARVHEESQRLNRRLDQKVQDLNSLLDLVRGLNSTLEASDVVQLLMLTLAGRWMLRRSALVAWKPGHPPALRQQGMDIGGLLDDEDARSGLKGLPDAIAVAELPEGALKERLSAAQGELVLPIKSGEGGVGGLIVLGPRPGQRPYEAADLEFGAGLVSQASVALANAWHFRETLEKKKMERELELAASIQANLFPSELPPLAGYDVAVRNRPARQCGGDYYDALPVRSDGGEPRVLLCVADVSGKGLPAALLMSNMQATLRALLGRLPSLCELAAQASELLFATTAANKYVTAALLELTPSSGAARYVSAGHTDCLLLRASGEEVWLKSTGAPLGLLVGVPYTDTTFALGAGDCLALFSDGVTEAQNEADEDFGEARLCDIVRSSAGESANVLVARIFDAVDRFAGTAPQFDDITVMVLKKLGISEK